MTTTIEQFRNNDSTFAHNFMFFIEENSGDILDKLNVYYKREKFVEANYLDYSIEYYYTNSYKAFTFKICFTLGIKIEGQDDIKNKEVYFITEFIPSDTEFNQFELEDKMKLRILNNEFNYVNQ